MTDDEIEELWMRRGNKAPAGCDQQGRLESRRWPETMHTNYGDDMTAPKAPRIVPCSTVARLWLALRRWLLG